MSFYHVVDGEIIKRLRQSPVQDGTLSELAERDVYPENVIEPELAANEKKGDRYEEWNAAEQRVDVRWTTIRTIMPPTEDWQHRGDKTETWDEAEKRLDITWSVETRPLARYKRQLAMAVVHEAVENAKFSERELVWAIRGDLPQAYADAVIAEDAAIQAAIKQKVIAIRQAATHADAKTAFDT